MFDHTHADLEFQFERTVVWCVFVLQDAKWDITSRIGTIYSMLTYALSMLLVFRWACPCPAPASGFMHSGRTDTCTAAIMQNCPPLLHR